MTNDQLKTVNNEMEKEKNATKHKQSKENLI